MKIIAVSAGHNRDAQGAAFGSVTEWQKAIEWQRLIITGLLQRGLRADEVPAVSLSEKIKHINRINIDGAKCDLAIEVHFNSDPAHKGTGSETLYCPGSTKGEALATDIQRAISAFCGPNRGAKPGWYRMDLPGHEDYKGDVDGDEVKDAFLSQTNCMAVIVEPYFIHELPRIEANDSAVCDVIAGVLFHNLLG